MLKQKIFTLFRPYVLQWDWERHNCIFSFPFNGRDITLLSVSELLSAYIVFSLEQTWPPFIQYFHELAILPFHNWRSLGWKKKGEIFWSQLQHVKNSCSITFCSYIKAPVTTPRAFKTDFHFHSNLLCISTYFFLYGNT